MEGLRDFFGNAYLVCGDYKAIMVHTGLWGDGKWHLYNLRNDPAESITLEGDMLGELAEPVEI